MKTFYSAEDIESLADRGQKEIRVDENVVLTDLAKQTARMLGIRITEKPSSALSGAFNHAHSQSCGKSHVPYSKPKGCQRRPAKSGEAPVRAMTAGQSRQVVDKLVERIKRINGKAG
jgi:hypothetical protein